METIESLDDKIRTVKLEMMECRAGIARIDGEVSDKIDRDRYYELQKQRHSLKERLANLDMQKIKLRGEKAKLQPTKPVDSSKEKHIGLPRLLHIKICLLEALMTCPDKAGGQQTKNKITEALEVIAPFVQNVCI